MSDEEEYYYEEPEEEDIDTYRKPSPTPQPASYSTTSKPYPFAKNNPYANTTNALSSSNSPLTTPRGAGYDARNNAISTPTTSTIPNKSHAVPTNTTNSNSADNRQAVELEVAKRLLQAQVTVTVQRYDAHIKTLLDNYFGALEERKLIFNASRAVAAPLLPFGGDGAEERSASVRFERMLIAANKAVEADLSSFRKKCMELRTDWQKEFMLVCQKSHEQERQRRDDFLNLHALCRKEVDATKAKMRAEFANKAVELAELTDLRASVEALGAELAATREALQSTRRLAEEDRARHFKDRETIITDYSKTLQAEREKFVEKIKELDTLMESERSNHLQELTAAAQRHARAVAEISSQLSEARESNSHYLSDASVARGEALADKKAVAEERAVLTRYIRDLEVALVESGGKPDALSSSRSATAYLVTGLPRRDNHRMTADGSYDASSSLYTPRGIHSSNTSHTNNLLPYQKSALRQAQATSIVDDMLGARSPNGATASNASMRSPSSLLPKDHSRIVEDVYNKPSFLQTIRSPSAEVRSSVGLGAAQKTRSASPNNVNEFNNSYSAAVAAPYRQPTFTSPTTSAIERQRTLRNHGGTLPLSPSGGSSTSGYFSSRR